VQFGVMYSCGRRVAEKWTKDVGSEDLHAQTAFAYSARASRYHPGDANDAPSFLPAPDTSFITGHVLTVYGGWTAGFARDF
jgi:hypothetical protein